ncbi:MAG: flagellar basal-body rod protein FlgF [Clostridiales bacterium]|nr:flagellar basal-body rod protein FlgF [Clostridiales bacterium]
MVRGLYTAYTGMLNQQHRLDTITNNLANSATTGYKREGSVAQAFDEVLMTKLKDGSESYVDKNIGKLNLGVKIGENYTDYGQGSFKETGNDFDLALGGDGFFEISFTNKAGVTSTKYTRDGSFTLNKDGYLVTKDGDFVQGQGGDIFLSTIADIRVGSQGDIYEDGALVDTLVLLDFEDYDYLEKYGENMYQEVEGAIPKEATATVTQGFLEASNVNVISEMVEMITITRAYESNQKVIQAIDETLDKAVNSVGAI